MTHAQTARAPHRNPASRALTQTGLDPDQASTVLCAGCGQPLLSPLDGPFDPGASAVLDWLAAIHDRLCEQQQQAQEVAP